MRFIFGLICSLLILSSSGLGLTQSTPDASTETGRPVNGFKEGVWKSYYPNSKSIHYQGSYRHGKRVGKWVWRYRNGAIKETQEYQNGSKHGIWVSYLRNGVTQSSGQFQKGLRDGKWLIRDSLNRFIRKGTYTNGVFRGDVYSRPTKNETVKIVYSNDRAVMESHETPKYRKEMWYDYTVLGNPDFMVDGLVGVITRIKSNKGLMRTEICHYLNNRRHGSCIKYNQQGKVIGHGFFKGGKYIKAIDLNPKRYGLLDETIRNQVKGIQKKKLQYAIPNTNQFKPKTIPSKKQ